jgi:intraflagellar transport protein 88
VCIPRTTCVAREAALKAQGVSEELQKRSEALGLQDNLNLDLQYAVRVCQAHCTQAAGMDQEALAMYSSLARNQEFLMGGRIRVNMGNMFAKRGQWTDAIKQYRMALDQIPSERQVR